MKNSITLLLISITFLSSAMEETKYAKEEVTECILTNKKTGWERLPRDIGNYLAHFIIHEHPAVTHLYQQPSLVPQISQRDLGNMVREVTFSPDQKLALILLSNDHPNSYRSDEPWSLSLGIGFWQPIPKTGKGNYTTLCNNETGSSIATLQHYNLIRSQEFSPDGKFILTASNDCSACIWDTSGKQIGTLSHKNTVDSATYSPDGKLIVTASIDGTINLWNAHDYTLKSTATNEDWAHIPPCFSPNSKMVAAALGNTVKIWHTQTGELIATLAHDEEVSSVVFSSDSKYLATTSKDKKSKLWHIEDGQCTLIVQDKEGSSVVFSPDSKHLATTSRNQKIKLWHIEDGQCTLIKHKTDIKSIIFSPDGSHYLSIPLYGNSLYVWHTKTKKLIAQLEHDNDITSYTFSQNGRMLATSSRFDGIVKIWAIPHYSCLATLSHGKFVRPVNFNVDGTQIIAVTGRIFDIATITQWDLRKLLRCKALLRNLSLPQAVLLDCLYKTAPQKAEDEQLDIKNHPHLQQAYTGMKEIADLLRSPAAPSPDTKAE